MAKKKRLITTLAPAQLINAIAVLQYRADQGEESPDDYDDILLVGGLPPNNPGNPAIVDACFAVGNAWNFVQKIDMLALEAEFYAGNCDFQTCVKQLRQHLNIDAFDSIYSIRNWQLFHEVFLSAYPNAEKIVYGDGYGLLDINSYEVLQPYNSDGYIQMDVAYLPQPGIEAIAGAFQSLPIHFVPFDYFERAIREVANQLPDIQTFCEEVMGLGDRPPSLILGSYVSETPYGKGIQAEISFNLSCILPYLASDDVLLVKGHPRETQQQSKLLVETLEQYGYRAKRIPDTYRTYPIEVFLPFLTLERALTFASSSCIAIAAIQQCELVVSFGTQLVSQYIKKDQRKKLLMNGHALAVMAQRAMKQDFQPVTYEQRQTFAQDAFSFEYPVRILPDTAAFDSSFRNPETEVLLAKLESDYLRSELMRVFELLQQEQTRMADLKSQIHQLQEDNMRLQQAAKAGFMDKLSQVFRSSSSS